MKRCSCPVYRTFRALNISACVMKVKAKSLAQNGLRTPPRELKSFQTDILNRLSAFYLFPHRNSFCQSHQPSFGTIRGFVTSRGCSQGAHLWKTATGHVGGWHFCLRLDLSAITPNKICPWVARYRDESWLCDSEYKPIAPVCVGLRGTN